MNTFISARDVSIIASGNSRLVVFFKDNLSKASELKGLYPCKYFFIALEMCS
jgi:hypothetical protein